MHGANTLEAMLSTSTDASPLWTRREAASHLGVSVATVRRMEGGRLHPVIDEQGVRRFAITEVRTLRVERFEDGSARHRGDGDVAAHVFELLRLGRDLRDIVITARVHPRVVRELYTEWLVSLRDGEQRRRDAASAAEDERRRSRVEREDRAWRESMVALGSPTKGRGSR